MQIPFKGILTTLRSNRNLAAFLISIVLMEIVHGIETMALYPLYLTEILGSSVTLVGAVVSMCLIVDIATRTPAGCLAVGPIAGGFPRERVYHLGRSNPAPRRHPSTTAHQSRFAL